MLSLLLRISYHRNTLDPIPRFLLDVSMTSYFSFSDKVSIGAFSALDFTAEGPEALELEPEAIVDVARFRNWDTCHCG